MSKPLRPLQPLTPDRLFKFAERMGSVERLFALAFSSAAADKEKSAKTPREETDAEKERRFASYRHARVKAIEAQGRNPWLEDINHYITKEELDYSLKKKLEVPAEERYQKMKVQRAYHVSSWFVRGLETYDHQGCYFYNCIPAADFILKLEGSKTGKLSKSMKRS